MFVRRDVFLKEYRFILKRSIVCTAEHAGKYVRRMRSESYIKENVEKNIYSNIFLLSGRRCFILHLQSVVDL